MALRDRDQHSKAKYTPSDATVRLLKEYEKKGPPDRGLRVIAILSKTTSELCYVDSGPGISCLFVGGDQKLLARNLADHIRHTGIDCRRHQNGYWTNEHPPKFVATANLYIPGISDTHAKPEAIYKVVFAYKDDWKYFLREETSISQNFHLQAYVDRCSKRIIPYGSSSSPMSYSGEAEYFAPDIGHCYIY